MTVHKTDMLKTLWGTVRQGKIELLESEELPEGTRVLVTLLTDLGILFRQCLCTTVTQILPSQKPQIFKTTHLLLKIAQNVLGKRLLYLLCGKSTRLYSYVKILSIAT